MNTYIITLTTADGDFFRYTHKSDYTPYRLIDFLVIKHGATHVKCAIPDQGWFIEKDYE